MISCCGSLVAVAFVQFPGIAPMGRAVFLTGAAVRLVEQIAIHPSGYSTKTASRNFGVLLHQRKRSGSFSSALSPAAKADSPCACSVICANPAASQSSGSNRAAQSQRFCRSLIRAHGGQRSPCAANHCAGAAKSIRNEASPNTLAISRTSSTHGAPRGRNMRPASRSACPAASAGGEIQPLKLQRNTANAIWCGYSSLPTLHSTALPWLKDNICRQTRKDFFILHRLDRE